jgi:DNA-binding NarL/FixJ family response regulator
MAVRSRLPLLLSFNKLTPSRSGRRCADERAVPVKILLVDDSQVVRAGIRSTIEQNTDWTVCGEAENGKIAITMVQTLEPHLVILDLSMPVMNGLDAARGISAIIPDMPMILFTLHRSQTLIEEARRAGIQHVFSKEDGFGHDVFEAIRAMLSV